MKRNNISITEIPEGGEEEQGLEYLFANIMTENFPDLVRENVSQVQEAHRVPIKMNPKKPTPRHITIKMAKFKDKERILKATRKKQLVTYKRAPIRLSVDFSTETRQAKKAQNIQSNEMQGPATKTTFSSMALM